MKRLLNYGCALSRLRFAYASAVLVLIAFPAAGQIAPNQHQAMLNTYCISCHNSRAKIGGLALILGGVGLGTGRLRLWRRPLASEA